MSEQHDMQLVRWLLTTPLEELDADETVQLPRMRLTLTAAEYYGLARGYPLEVYLSGDDPILVTLGRNPECATLEHPTRGCWFSAVGPVFTEQHVTEWLDISADELAALVGEHRVLALVPREDTERHFPIFQFAADRSLLPRLQELYPILEHLGGPWDIARWLNEPYSGYGGLSAVQMLRMGHGDLVLSGARRDAARTQN